MAGLWSRFKAWREEQVRQADPVGVVEADEVTKEQTMTEPDRKERKGGWLTRWRAPKRQEQQMATLQEGFTELVGLTRSIREHMEQQALTQKSLVEMIEHLPGAVEGLKSVGEATKQQTETLGLLKRQLEAAARNEEHMLESMKNFNKTLSLMDDLSKSTSQTVSSMADRTRDSEELLRSILERSERRLVYLIVALMVVTIGVLGAGMYLGFSQRGLDAPPPVPAIEEPAEEAPEAFDPKKSISELEEAEPEAEVEADKEPVAPEMEADPDTLPEDATELESELDDRVPEPLPTVGEPDVWPEDEADPVEDPDAVPLAEDKAEEAGDEEAVLPPLVDEVLLPAEDEAVPAKAEDVIEEQAEADTDPTVGEQFMDDLGELLDDTEGLETDDDYESRD